MANIELFKLFGTILIDNTRANQQLEQTESRAQKVGRTLGNMITTAAKWGAGIAAGATAAGGALLALASRAARSADALNVNAQRAGTTTTAFQEMRYALTQVGVAESDVSMSLQRLNQRVGEAEEGSSKYAQALQRLGVSTRDVNGEIKSSDALFMELVTRLNQVEDAQLRAALGGQIFGVNLAQRLLPAIEAGGDALAELRNRAHAVGAVMDEEAVSAGARFSGALGELRSVAGNVFNQFALRLVPVFERFVQFAVDNLPKIGPVMEFIGEVVEIVIRHTRRVLDPFFDSVKAFLGTVWSFTIGIAGAAWDWIIGTTWQQKWEDITGWLTTAYTWTIGIAGKAWDWIVGTSWSEKMEDLKGWVSSAWAWTVNLGGTAWSWLEEKAPWLTGTLQTLWGFVGTAWTWTVDMSIVAWEWLEENAPWLTTTLETIWEYLQRAWTWTVNTAGTAWAWLVGTSFEDKWNNIKALVATAWEWIINTSGAAWEWLDEKAPALTALLETIWGWIETAWTWTINTAGSAWEWLVGTTLQEKIDAIKALLATALALVVNIAGTAWEWITGTTWSEKMADIKGWISSAWAWTVNVAGTAWAWLDEKFPALTAALQTLSDWFSSAWEWTMDLAGVQSAVEWFEKYEEAIVAITAGITAGVVAFKGINAGIALYTALTTGAATATGLLGAAIALVTSPVFLIAAGIGALVAGGVYLYRNWETVVEWAGKLWQSLVEMKDKGVEAVRNLYEGVTEWFGETKLGKALNGVGEMVRGVTGWFADMYDKVVGNSYVPDMVEEIGEAIERLRDKLANPVVRYTAQALEAFEDLEEGAAASMMRMAEVMDDVLKSIGDRISGWISDTTRLFFNGTASWTGILDSFAGAIGGIFGTVFDGITKELVANILAQNQWLVTTLANIATSVTAFLGQAYAALVGFFWFLGPGAPVAAAGVIAAAIAGIAAIGGQIVRGILPDPPSGGGGGDIGGGGGAGGTGPRVGRQVSEITGPTRDLLTDLLTPLVSLNTLTGIGERIYNLLNERLPMPGMQLASVGAAGVGGFHITIEREAVQVIRTGGGDTDIDDETIEDIAERLAEKIAFQLRGAGQ